MAAAPARRDFPTRYFQVPSTCEDYVMAESSSKLDPEAEAFYAKLRPEDYPKALIEGYPRIANHVVSLGNNKVALTAYFNSLLSDDRGGRQGFPFPVLINIQNLFDIMVGIPDGFADTERLFVSSVKKN
jgi:hypothetical protein